MQAGRRAGGQAGGLAGGYPPKQPQPSHSAAAELGPHPLLLQELAVGPLVHSEAAAEAFEDGLKQGQGGRGVWVRW